jgi:N-acetylmuramoyl-L-alanine amidase
MILKRDFRFMKKIVFALLGIFMLNFVLNSCDEDIYKDQKTIHTNNNKNKNIKNLEDCSKNKATIEQIIKNDSFGSTFFIASPNVEERCVKIDELVFHYTAAELNATLRTFLDVKSTKPVSVHYVVTRKGSLIQLVDEKLLARHSGKSFWQHVPQSITGSIKCYSYIRDMSSDVILKNNHQSIGIEIINLGFTDNSYGERRWYEFDEDQITIVIQKAKEIIAKYNINPTRVVGHQDIAPNRKSDPGVLFPWKKLYEEHKIGAWITDNELNGSNRKLNYDIIELSDPVPQNPNEAFMKKYLILYGYNVSEYGFNNCLTAFKMHFTENGLSENFKRNDCIPKITLMDMKYIQMLYAKYRCYLNK